MSTTEIVVRGDHVPVVVAKSGRSGEAVYLRQAKSWILLDAESFEEVIKAVDTLFEDASEPQLGKLHTHRKPEALTPAKWIRSHG